MYPLHADRRVKAYSEYFQRVGQCCRTALRSFLRISFTIVGRDRLSQLLRSHSGCQFGIVPLQHNY
jgi:hypothetical protein